MPPGEILQKVRQEIDYNQDEVKGLLSGRFKEYFGEIAGETLKRPPRGYTADHPMIDLIKHKSFLMMHELSDNELASQDALASLIDVYGVMVPWNTFMNRAMD